jgi:hypothetical protein
MGGTVTAATDTLRSPLRELAHRQSDGLEVALFWNSVTSELTVSVSDGRSGAYFELPAAPEDALEVFHHPYAYAAFRGLPYDDALLPSWIAAAAAARGSADTQQLAEPTR